MRKGPTKQSPRAPEPRKPPLDFCPSEAWPKQAPGPPPIMNPVIHSPARPNSAIRMLNPSQLDGPTRGVSEAKLLVKYAADKQQGELSLLLKGGQNPNVMEKVEWQPFATTPLFEASVNGYKRIVRVLLEHGAKVDGFTAVYNAALNGHFECTRLLVGGQRGLTTDSGYTPLYVACQKGTPIAWPAFSHHHDDEGLAIRRTPNQEPRRSTSPPRTAILLREAARCGSGR